MLLFLQTSICFSSSASSAGSLELVDLLLKNGAAPVCQRGTGLSPLHLACEAGHLPVLQRLLQVSCGTYLCANVLVVFHLCT